MQVSTTIEGQNGQMVVKRLSVPIGLEELMEGLTKEVIAKKPQDIPSFASNHFAKLLELRDKGSKKDMQKRKTAFIVKPVKHSLLKDDNNQNKKAIGVPLKLTRQINVRQVSPTKKENFIDAKIRIKRDVNMNEAKPKMQKAKTVENADKNLKIEGKRTKRAASTESLNHRKSKEITAKKFQPQNSKSVEERKSEKVNEKQQTTQKYENEKIIPKDSSIEEDKNYIKDGRLAVTPSRILKKTPSVTDKSELEATKLIIPAIGIATKVIPKGEGCVNKKSNQNDVDDKCSENKEKKTDDDQKFNEREHIRNENKEKTPNQFKNIEEDVPSESAVSTTLNKTDDLKYENSIDEKHTEDTRICDESAKTKNTNGELIEESCQEAEEKSTKIEENEAEKRKQMHKDAPVDDDNSNTKTKSEHENSDTMKSTEEIGSALLSEDNEKNINDDANIDTEKPLKTDELGEISNEQPESSTTILSPSNFSSTDQSSISYDPDKLRRELIDAETESRLSSFTTSYNPYSLRSEIRNASATNEGEMKMSNKEKIIKFLNEVTAAIKIQSVWRGFKARRFFKNKNEETRENVNLQKEDNKESSKQLEKEIRAVVKIQSLWRGFKARKMLKEKTSSMFGAAVKPPKPDFENLVCDSKLSRSNSDEDAERTRLEPIEENKRNENGTNKEITASNETKIFDENNLSELQVDDKNTELAAVEEKAEKDVDKPKEDEKHNTVEDVHISNNESKEESGGFEPVSQKIEQKGDSTKECKKDDNEGDKSKSEPKEDEVSESSTLLLQKNETVDNRDEKEHDLLQNKSINENEEKLSKEIEHLPNQSEVENNETMFVEQHEESELQVSDESEKSSRIKRETKELSEKDENEGDFNKNEEDTNLDNKLEESIPVELKDHSVDKTKSSKLIEQTSKHIENNELSSEDINNHKNIKGDEADEDNINADLETKEDTKEDITVNTTFAINKNENKNNVNLEGIDDSKVESDKRSPKESTLGLNFKREVDDANAKEAESTKSYDSGKNIQSDNDKKSEENKQKEDKSLLAESANDSSKDKSEDSNSDSIIGNKDDENIEKTLGMHEININKDFDSSNDNNVKIGKEEETEEKEEMVNTSDSHEQNKLNSKSEIEEVTENKITELNIDNAMIEPRYSNTGENVQDIQNKAETDSKEPRSTVEEKETFDLKDETIRKDTKKQVSVEKLNEVPKNIDLSEKNVDKSVEEETSEVKQKNRQSEPCRSIESKIVQHEISSETKEPNVFQKDKSRNEENTIHEEENANSEQADDNTQRTTFIGSSALHLNTECSSENNKNEDSLKNSLEQKEEYGKKNEENNINKIEKGNNKVIEESINNNNKMETTKKGIQNVAAEEIQQQENKDKKVEVKKQKLKSADENVNENNDCPKESSVELKDRKEESKENQDKDKDENDNHGKNAKEDTNLMVVSDENKATIENVPKSDTKEKLEELKEDSGKNNEINAKEKEDKEDSKLNYNENSKIETPRENDTLRSDDNDMRISEVETATKDKETNNKKDTNLTLDETALNDESVTKIEAVPEKEKSTLDGHDTNISRNEDLVDKGETKEEHPHSITPESSKPEISSSISALDKQSTTILKEDDTKSNGRKSIENSALAHEITGFNGNSEMLKEDSKILIQKDSTGKFKENSNENETEKKSTNDDMKKQTIDINGLKNDDSGSTENDSGSNDDSIKETKVNVKESNSNDEHINNSVDDQKTFTDDKDDTENIMRNVTEDDIKINVKESDTDDVKEATSENNGDIDGSLKYNNNKNKTEETKTSENSIKINKEEGVEEKEENCNKRDEQNKLSNESEINEMAEKKITELKSDNAMNEPGCLKIEEDVDDTTRNKAEIDSKKPESTVEEKETLDLREDTIREDTEKQAFLEKLNGITDTNTVIEEKNEDVKDRVATKSDSITENPSAEDGKSGVSSLENAYSSDVPLTKMSDEEIAKALIHLDKIPPPPGSPIIIRANENIEDGVPRTLTRSMTVNEPECIKETVSHLSKSVSLDKIGRSEEQTRFSDNTLKDGDKNDETLDNDGLYETAPTRPATSNLLTDPNERSRINKLEKHNEKNKLTHNNDVNRIEEESNKEKEKETRGEKLEHSGEFHYSPFKENEIFSKDTTADTLAENKNNVSNSSSKLREEIEEASKNSKKSPEAEEVFGSAESHHNGDKHRLTEDIAATIIQSTFRGHRVRRDLAKVGKKLSKIEEETLEKIKGTHWVTTEDSAKIDRKEKHLSLQNSSEFHDSIPVGFEDENKPNNIEDNEEPVQDSDYEDSSNSKDIRTIEKEKSNGSSDSVLKHSSELHDHVITTSSVQEVKEEEAAPEDESRFGEVSKRDQETDRATLEEKNEAVQCNQDPAGDATMTSPTAGAPASAGVAPIVDATKAQASDKDASTRVDEGLPPDSDSSSADFGMEAEKRNNASYHKKNMEAEAATKIQASFRGYQVRKQLKVKSAGGDLKGSRRLIRRKSSGRITESGRSSQSKNKTTDIEEKSATKIQAGVRGFLVRRRQQKSKKEGNES